MEADNTPAGNGWQIIISNLSCQGIVHSFATHNLLLSAGHVAAFASLRDRAFLISLFKPSLPIVASGQMLFFIFI